MNVSLKTTVRRLARPALKLAAALFVALAAAPALAIETGLNTTAQTAQLPTGQTDFAVIIGNIIQPILGLVGVVFLVLTIYAGVLWMTASGNEENVKKAKDILKAAVIGMIIIFASYAITSFVLVQVASSLGGGGSAKPPNEQCLDAGGVWEATEGRCLMDPGQQCLDAGGVWEATEGRCLM